MAKQKKNEYKLVGKIPYINIDDQAGEAELSLCASAKVVCDMKELQEEKYGYGVLGTGYIEIFEKEGKLYFKGVTKYDEENEEWIEDYVELNKKA
jgi:hypothetical protein